MAAVTEPTVERSSWCCVVVLHTWILSPAVGASFVLATMGVTSVKTQGKISVHLSGLIMSFLCHFFFIYSTANNKKSWEINDIPHLVFNARKCISLQIETTQIMGENVRLISLYGYICKKHYLNRNSTNGVPQE